MCPPRPSRAATVPTLSGPAAGCRRRCSPKRRLWGLALGLALSLLAARGLGLSGVAPAVEGALAKLERPGKPEFSEPKNASRRAVGALRRHAERQAGEIEAAGDG